MESRTDSPMRLSFPSCQDLGIPLHSDDYEAAFFPGRMTGHLTYHISNSKTPSKPDPFSPYSMIPLPSPFILDAAAEPTFIRKRNERERERVRCVNDGYSRLKEHIPLDNKDKRVSKVEILRTAISYIKHLQGLLDSENIDVQNENDDSKQENQAAGLKRSLTLCDAGDDETYQEPPHSRETRKKSRPRY